MPLRFRRRKRNQSQYLYASFYRRPLPLAERIIIFLLMIAMFALAIVSIVLIQLRPLIYKMAKTAVTDVVMTEVNDVIQEETLTGAFDYSKLVTLEKDNDGNISALTTNTALINTLQAKISNGVFKKVQNEVMTELKIPIGNAIGGMMFSGHGPNFKVRILSVADVDTKFSNDFEQAGINQTRHKIYLDIWVEIDIIVPGYQSETLKVTNQVAVAETVIVGRVPSVYANIGEKPS